MILPRQPQHDRADKQCAKDQQQDHGRTYREIFAAVTRDLARLAGCPDPAK